MLWTSVYYKWNSEYPTIIEHAMRAAALSEWCWIQKDGGSGAESFWGYVAKGEKRDKGFLQVQQWVKIRNRSN